MLPLERDGLISIKDGTLDRRSKALHLTKAGAERVRVAQKVWKQAQTGLEATFGSERASKLRNALHLAVGVVRTVARKRHSGVKDVHRFQQRRLSLSNQGCGSDFSSLVRLMSRPARIGTGMVTSANASEHFH